MQGGLDQGSWQLIQPGGKRTVLDPSPVSRERVGRKGKVASAGDDVQGLGRKNGGFLDAQTENCGREQRPGAGRGVSTWQPLRLRGRGTAVLNYACIVRLS